MMSTVDYTVVDTPFGAVGVAATAKGLCTMAPVTEEPAGLDRFLALARRGRAGALLVAHEPGAALPPRLAEGVSALAGYVAGRGQAYRGELDLAGTPFQRAVWERLLAIPWGATLSYGEIAVALGRPEAARAVGAAVGANPVSLLVPCHRVVGARGALTGYAFGLDLKRVLLEHERRAPAVA